MLSAYELDPHCTWLYGVLEHCENAVLHEFGRWSETFLHSNITCTNNLHLHVLITQKATPGISSLGFTEQDCRGVILTLDSTASFANSRLLEGNPAPITLALSHFLILLCAYISSLHTFQFKWCWCGSEIQPSTRVFMAVENSNSFNLLGKLCQLTWSLSNRPLNVSSPIGLSGSEWLGFVCNYTLEGIFTYEGGAPCSGGILDVKELLSSLAVRKELEMIPDFSELSGHRSM